MSRNPKGWTIGHIKARRHFPDTKEGELAYWDLKNIRPEWQWFNALKGIMTPSEMKEWLEKENIFQRITNILDEQIIFENI